VPSTIIVPRHHFGTKVSFTWTSRLVSISSDADGAKMRQRPTDLIMLGARDCGPIIRRTPSTLI